MHWSLVSLELRFLVMRSDNVGVRLARDSEAGRATAGARLGQGDDFWYFVFTQAATSHLVFVTRRRSEKD